MTPKVHSKSPVPCTIIPQAVLLLLALAALLAAVEVVLLVADVEVELGKTKVVDESVMVAGSAPPLYIVNNYKSIQG